MCNSFGLDHSIAGYRAMGPGLAHCVGVEANSIFISDFYLVCGPNCSTISQYLA